MLLQQLIITHNGINNKSNTFMQLITGLGFTQSTIQQAAL